MYIIWIIIIIITIIIIALTQIKVIIQKWEGKICTFTMNIINIFLIGRTMVSMNKKFWEELVANFPLIWHGSHRKRRFQQFFYCYVCIRCRGNVLIEPLHSKDKGIRIQTHRLIGSIYEVRRLDGLKFQNIYIKFHKDRFRHSKVDEGDSQTHRYHGDLICYFHFFKTTKVG
jgi:hypothetical protein